MYREIKPSERLNNVIDSFWIFSDNEVSERFKVLPDTCTDIIFDLNQNKGFLSGVMTNYQQLELASSSELIGVRFKTEKFGSLSHIPLNETKNLRIELSDVFLDDHVSLINQLTHLDTISSRINVLEIFIATLCNHNIERQDQMIVWVAQNIRLLRGNVNVRNLAKSVHLSLRQLERRFKRYIGMTIKEFSNIVRFNSTRKVIESHTEVSLLEIAFDMGFFDHSHMNYEFNRISGENPSSFR